MKPTDKPSDSSAKLSEMIKKAINDCELTTTEFDRIMALVDADGVVDQEEQKLLSQLQEMLANQTIKKVPG